MIVPHLVGSLTQFSWDALCASRLQGWTCHIILVLRGASTLVLKRFLPSIVIPGALCATERFPTNLMHRDRFASHSAGVESLSLASSALGLC